MGLSRSDSADRVKVGFHLPRQTLRKLGAIAALLDTTRGGLLEEAITEFLAEWEIHPVDLMARAERGGEPENDGLRLAG